MAEGGAQNNWNIAGLPLDSSKRLTKVTKSEREVKASHIPHPAASKEFFSFFNLSSYEIPIGPEKHCIDIDDNTDK